MRKVLSAVLFLILLFSCEKSGFDFSSARLTVDNADGKERGTFSIFLSDEESRYDIILSSSDGLLTWQGELESRGEGIFSLSLDITDGSFFPQGEYTFKIFSSSGVEQEGKLDFRREAFSLYLEDGVIAGSFSGSASVAGRPVDLGSPAESGTKLSYRDEYFNSYEITL